MEVQPPKDWSTSRGGGMRRTVVRDDLHQPDAIGKATKSEVEATQVSEIDTAPALEDPGATDREDAFLKEMGLA